MIGPNGSGKSNLLDALSFVLGLRLEKDKSRASVLTDLLHKKQDETLADIEAAGKGREIAWVQLVYRAADGQTGRDERARQCSEGERQPACRSVLSTSRSHLLSSCPCSLGLSAGTESNFRRTVTSKGVSTYAVDNRKQSAAQYKAALEDIGIWVEAKNFLVFQVRPRRGEGGNEGRARSRVRSWDRER